MAKLIYAINTTLDGYFEDRAGKFDWTQPTDEVLGFFNDLIRPVGTHVYGRRMYETMAVWETLDAEGELSAVMREFARLWRGADKLVFSTALKAATTPRTTLLREFTPEAIRKLKAESSKDVTIGGPTLAASAFEAGLIDECHLVLLPVSVGGGKPALPTGQRLDLELLASRRFENGTMHLHYRVRR
jgi:dihydrofolate reductase